jgi:hypothetical protein
LPKCDGSVFLFDPAPASIQRARDRAVRKTRQTKNKNHAFSNFLARPGKPCLLAPLARISGVWGGFRGFPGVWETFKRCFCGKNEKLLVFPPKMFFFVFVLHLKIAFSHNFVKKQNILLILYFFLLRVAYNKKLEFFQNNNLRIFSSIFTILCVSTA